MKYTTLKEEYKKIQKDWRSERLWRSFSSLCCCASPTANKDKYYQQKLLELFIKHKLPHTATSSDIINCIEDFIIPEDRSKLYEKIIQNVKLKEKLSSCIPLLTFNNC